MSPSEACTLHQIDAPVKNFEISHNFIKGRCLPHYHIGYGILIISFPILASLSFRNNHAAMVFSRTAYKFVL